MMCRFTVDSIVLFSGVSELGMCHQFFSLGSRLRRNMLAGIMTLLVGLAADTSFGQAIYVSGHAYGPDEPLVREMFSWNSEIYLPPSYSHLQIRGWYNANTIQGDSGWRVTDFNDIVSGPGDYHILHRGLYPSANERYVDTITQMTWFANGVWNYWQSEVVRIPNPYYVGLGGGQFTSQIYAPANGSIERKRGYTTRRSVR